MYFASPGCLRGRADEAREIDNRGPAAVIAEQMGLRYIISSKIVRSKITSRIRLVRRSVEKTKVARCVDSPHHSLLASGELRHHCTKKDIPQSPRRSN